MPLPLFPLTVVLYPGTLLPLHIFELRYQQLVTDVVEGDHQFGILPPSPTGADVGTVGTVAQIRAVHQLKDGRSNIVVSGESRFTLERMAASDTPYHMGEVAPLEDEPDIQQLPEPQVALVLALAERYAEAVSRLNDTPRNSEFSPDLGRLTFQVAALLDWDFIAKQHFLTMRSAVARATRLLHALPPLLVAAEERAAIHARAATNGKGSHHDEGTKSA